MILNSLCLFCTKAMLLLLPRFNFSIKIGQNMILSECFESKNPSACFYFEKDKVYIKIEGNASKKKEVLCMDENSTKDSQ